MRTWTLLACSPLLAAAAACGGDDGNATHPDAPKADAPKLDAPPDAPVATTCVSTGQHGTVTVEGPWVEPGEGLTVTVLVQDASGALSSRSDPQGANAHLTLDVPSCGMVTVHQHEADSPANVFTWTGVQPGDHLVDVDNRPAFVEHDVAVTVPEFTGATAYLTYFECDGGGTAESFSGGAGPDTLTMHCAPGSTTVSVSALVFVGDATVAFSIAPDTTLAASGTTTVAIPAYGTAPQHLALSLHGATSVPMGQTFEGDVFAATAAGPFVAVGAAQAQFGASDDVAAAPIPVPTGAGATVLHMSQLTSDGSITSALLRGTAALPTTLTAQPSDFLPTPSGAIDADAARPTVTWSMDHSAQVPLVVLGANIGSTDWVMIAPGTPGAVRFPELPADLLGTDASALTVVELLDAAEWPTYDAARVGLRELVSRPTTSSRLSERAHGYHSSLARPIAPHGMRVSAALHR